MSRTVGRLVLLAVILGSTLWVSRAKMVTNDEAGTPWTPTVALSPDGQLWAAWVADTGDDREIVTSRWTGRGWEPATVVYANPGRWDTSPSLAFDADGTAWLAWSSSTGTDDSLHLSHWTGAGWSAPQEVPARQTMPNEQPVLAPAPDGGLWLAWVGFDGNDDEIYAAFWDGANWSEPQRVGADDTDPAAYDTQPRLAVGPDGRVWAAWVGYEKFLDDEIFSAYWDGQRWTAEQQVSRDDDSADAYPSLAVADDGAVWLAWHGWPADAPDAGRRIFAAHRDESGDWSNEAMISSPLNSIVSEDRPGLALDADGQPHVTWHVADGTLGLGYAAFDGARWSSPRWPVQEAIADGLYLAAGNSPAFVWMPIDASAARPFNQQSLGDALPPLPVFEPPARPLESSDIVINRHVAFGDSITWGLYQDPETGEMVGEYPPRLEDLLDTRVVESEVINEGVPGERTPAGDWRIGATVLPTYNPNFVEIMEGTNDVTSGRPPNDIAGHLEWMIRKCKGHGSKALLSTLTPRIDSFNDEVAEMNGYIVPLAAQMKVPLVDNWQAFQNYGDLDALLIDHIHPNSLGMQVLANSWYNGILSGFSWLNEETEPPVTWITFAEGDCKQVKVEWTGTDNMSWVVDYDVQVSVNSLSAWTDWLVATPITSSVYTGGNYNDTLYFRVRGRDVAGNESAYSDAKSATTADNEPPYEVMVSALPPAQTSPFDVRWSGKDDCSGVDEYDVETCVGTLANCTAWKTTSDTSATFNPDSPQYGLTYYFRARARDKVGKQSPWSSAVSTILARYAVDGQVLTVREEPIVGAQVVAPDAVAVQRSPGGEYVAYFVNGGSFDLDASRSGFGAQPAMLDVPVAGNISNLDFVLPPADGVVSDGDFESGNWGQWQISGTLTPTLAGEAHTGDGAVLMGGPGSDSSLSQSLNVPGTLTNATLSFMVRLDDETNGNGTLKVGLEGTGISHSQVVSTEQWTHVWLPVDAAVGQAATLTFAVSDAPAVHLDEVYLGSAQSGGSIIYLPIMLKNLGQ